jgi:integrase
MARKIRGKNEGSLHQRPNRTWRVQISLNGKRIGKGFKSKAEAQDWLRNTQVEIVHGYDYQAGKITLGEYLPRWLENSKATLRPTTAHQYELIMRKHILSHLGGIKLREIRLDNIEQYYSELIQSGVGIRTVRVTHNILHKAFEKAVRYGLVSTNQVHGAALPRYKSREMTVLNASQVTQFLAATRDSKYQALYHLAVTTGMREGELFGLKWSDLHWNNGTLHIQRQVQKIPGKPWKFSEPKTASGRRMIKLGEGTLLVLREHKERQAFQKAVAGDRWQEYDLIFPTSVGTPGDPSNLRVDFLKMLERAGLPIIRFHDLRHTAASLLLNHGIPVLVVSKMLGHANPSVTLDVYGHLYHDSQYEAAKVMDALVTPIPVNLKNTAKQGQSEPRGENELHQSAPQLHH